MKKKILELLRELEGLMHDDSICLKIFTDYSGEINGTFEPYIIEFSSEPELIQGLKDKIK